VEHVDHVVEVRNAPKIFVKKGRNYLGDQGIDGKVILKWSLGE
jgi:hypothetical protein